MESFTDSRGSAVPLPPGEPVSWRVSGYALVRDTQGRYLMVQSGGGLWHFPGGGIEQTETIIEGVTRECLEETGYAVKVSRMAPYFLREQRFYHRREQAFYRSVQLFYEATLARPEADESRITDHDQSRRREWLNLSALAPDTIHPAVVKLVAQLKNAA